MQGHGRAAGEQVGAALLGCPCTPEHTNMHTPHCGSLQPCIHLILLSRQEMNFIRGVEALTRMGNGNSRRM